MGIPWGGGAVGVAALDHIYIYIYIYEKRGSHQVLAVSGVPLSFEFTRESKKRIAAFCNHPQLNVRKSICHNGGTNCSC